MEDYTNFLPPGFHFDPTDEELISYFLHRKASDLPNPASFIPELHFYSTEPSELNDKAFLSKNQYYFFSRVMENRTTERGHWEELEIDKTIATSSGEEVGIKKYLLFYIDEVPKSIQTSWMMEEYHLPKRDFFSRYCKTGQNDPSDLNEWVLCRVHDAKTGSQAIDGLQSNGDEVELSLTDEVFLAMEDYEDEISFPN